ncbi:HK97 family phage prohead protease [Sphingomonas sp. CFBP9019]|uniref:HK97 family phage prohead protease n=1 Tax=Sphingomonas sp. CFBP9019 TaxID=3096532 RepID=UPI0039C900E6
MSWRAGIHGYAARWGVVTAPLSRPHAPHLSRPARFERGCFSFDASSVEMWFMHRDAQSFGRGDALGLQIWEDSYGLAFAFTPPSSAYSMVCGVADGRYAQCSVGIAIDSSSIEPYGSGVEAISSARLNEISICPRGACPGTACWHAANVPYGLPAHAQAVLPIWMDGWTGVAA